MKTDWQTTAAKMSEVLQFVREHTTTDLYQNLPIFPQTMTVEDFATLPTVTHDDFLSYDPHSLVHTSGSDIKFFPSKFDLSHDDFFMHPRPADAIWSNVVVLGKKHNVNAVGIFLPAVWQLSAVAYRTAKQLGVPLVAPGPSNLMVIEQVLSETAVDFIITTPAVLEHIRSQLEDPTLLDHVKAWIIIMPVNQTDVALKVCGEVVVEFHTFPGLSVVHARYDVATQSLDELVYAPDYYFEYGGEGAIKTITSLECTPLPLIRYQVDPHSYVS